jgi:uncharacterized hydrophobic protein (TIGR00271 family)
LTNRRNIPEELLLHVAKRAQLDGSYIAFMSMAGILASVGMLANSVPVLIGSMVVAPAFPPLSLVAFGAVAGQWKLALRGLGTALLGLGLAVGFAVLTTWTLNWTGVLAQDTNLLSNPLLEERVRPGWYSLVAAFAAGIAGTLATLKDKMDTLVGTVASLALVPAGGAAGIALLSADPLRAMGGVVLLTINVGLIIATGILVLVVAGPRHTQE